MLGANYLYVPNKISSNELIQNIKFNRELPLFYETEDIANRFQIGMEAIVKELPHFLEKPEMDKIYNELLYGLEKCLMTRKAQRIETTRDKRVPSERFGVSEATMSAFYEAGARLFKKHEYENAANAFFILTMLDYRRYNAWLSFGLSEQQSGNLEAALYGYAMASVHAANSPFPYIYSAECAIKMGQKEQAEKCLSMSEEVLSLGHHDGRGHLADYIAKIRNQIHSNA
jgi:hypothetical protein